MFNRFNADKLMKPGALQGFAQGLGLWVLAFQVGATEMPWHLGSLGNGPAAASAIQTAKIAPGPHPVVVAIIDSGIILDHPSLGDQVLPGFDMLSGVRNLRGGRSSDATPDPRASRCGAHVFSTGQRTHGTEVASIVAGNGQDGVFGVNPKAKIVPVRTMGACGMNRSDLLDAIAWSAGLPVAGIPLNPNPARVINLSLSGGAQVCERDLQSVIDRVVSKGVFVVAAAGNSYQKPLNEPANCNGVISVGAVDTNNRIANYSALDPRTTIYAPGGSETQVGQKSAHKLRVATYVPDAFGQERANALDRGVGTSYAAPLVSGFISLWLSHQPHKTPADFLAELPAFVRNVQAIPSCPSCQPKSLAANSQMFKK